MKPRRGLTLMEMLVALAVFSILFSAGYASIHHGLALQRSLQIESARIVSRCELAEQLTADFRAHRAVRQASADHLAITTAGGKPVLYVIEPTRVQRVVAGDLHESRAFDVGQVAFSLATLERGPMVLRVRFADIEWMVGP